MKIIRRNDAGEAVEIQSFKRPGWKLLVVDDEPDVRHLTELNLRGFTFAGRGLDFIHASSGAEAREQLVRHSDIAVALIDVVMETDDAGLKLAEAIRTEFGYSMMRIIIRTGQPGVAPERYVIDNFDIDDYKDKTELTVQKLYTTIRSAIKAYNDLYSIELNRVGLKRVLEATPYLFELQHKKLEAFFEGVLLQVIAICRLSYTGLISTVDGLLLTKDGNSFVVRAGAGDLDPSTADPKNLMEIVQFCTESLKDENPKLKSVNGSIVVPLVLDRRLIGFVYLESSIPVSLSDTALIQVMADQCASAIENLCLHNSLRGSYTNMIEMLALVAEYKDCSAGGHIRRTSEWTRMIALELGLSADEADDYAKAALLHDVGKVGVPDSILSKPGPLDSAEMSMVKTHTSIGRNLLAHEPTLALAQEVALHHHERWSGSGYPDRLAGTAIPLISRIVAVADVFDTLINRRPYKTAWPQKEAVMEIERAAGKLFDPEVADALLRLYSSGKLDLLLRGTKE